MNLHSIRVKSTLPMVMLAFTLVVVVAMFSYLSAMQKRALDAQANNFLNAISLVLNADRDLYQAKLATTYALNKTGDIAAQQQDARDNAAQVKQRFADYLKHLAQYPDIRGEFSGFDSQFNQWQQASEQLLSAAGNGADTSVLLSDEEQKFASLRDVLDKALKLHSINPSANNKC